MGNLLMVWSRTWATSHPSWTDACESAYDYLWRSLTPEERETAKITPLEPLRRETINGHEVMVWRTTVELMNGWIIAADVLDNLPRDQAAPSVRVGQTPPTPPPPTGSGIRPVDGALN